MLRQRMKFHTLFVAGASMMFIEAVSQAEVKVTAERHTSGAGFKFKTVPLPARDDAAARAQFKLVDGEKDGNSAGLEVTLTHDQAIVRKLNAAAREGRYSEQLWQDWTHRTLTQLGEEWKKQHEDRLAKAKADAEK